MSTSGAVVLLDALVARDAAGPRGGSRGSLQGVSAGLGAGVNVFLGTPEDGTIALCDALAGVRPALRGAVRFGSDDPWWSPSARARTGALLAAPDLPEAGTVRASVALALAALGLPESAADPTLVALGLGALAGRRIAALSFAEARAVELALAFAVAKAAPPPALAVLFEPCGDVALPGGARAVDDVVAALRDAGACVVIATSSTADARRFADVLWTLHRGAIVRRDAGGKALVPGEAEIAVWLPAAAGPAARSLAAALAESPAIRSAFWEDAAAGRPPVVRVRGPERDACALAVVDAAARLGVAVEAITSVVPDLQHVRSAALARYLHPAGPPRPRPPEPAPQAPSPRPVASPPELAAPPAVPPPPAQRSAPLAAGSPVAAAPGASGFAAGSPVAAPPDASGFAAGSPVAAPPDASGFAAGLPVAAAPGASAVADASVRAADAAASTVAGSSPEADRPSKPVTGRMEEAELLPEFPAKPPPGADS